MSDDMSPDIAALLADTDSLPNSNLPSLDDIPEVPVESKSSNKPSNQATVDLSKKTFKPIEKYFLDTHNPVLTDAAYYKTALSGEKEASQRLHNMLTKYLTC